MEDLPKIYQMKKDKHFNNNKEVYMSNMRDEHNEVLSIIDIRKKINNILSSNNFIYRTKVNIVIGNKTIEKKIIGIYNNNLVTIDNEQIPISSIKDIYK